MHQMTTRRRKKVHLEEGFDRLSSLPDPIKEHIVSHLPTPEAVRMSILSKSWRAFWTQLPCLDLDLSNRFLDADWTEKENIRLRELFYDFIDFAFRSVLMLEKVKLCVPGYSSGFKSRVDNWVVGAFGHRLTEFEMQVKYESKVELNYVLPNIIFVSNLITKLTLTLCKVDESSLRDVNLPSLSYLCLKWVYIDEQHANNFLANCPNLEDLNYNSSYGFQRLKISGLAKLKKADIKYNRNTPSVIEIEAPSLLELTISYDVSSDEKGVCEIKLVGCTNMKKLKAIGNALGDSDLHSLVESLPLLERLELDRCRQLKHIEVSSPHLVHLEFMDCTRLRKAKVNAPNLKYFHYKGANPIRFPLIRRSSTPMLKEAAISLRPPYKKKKEKLFKDLVKFLTMFRHCERLTVCVSFTQDLIIPQEIRKKHKPPLSGVKHLMVKLRAIYTSLSDVEFVESLLWLAPCPDTISISDHLARFSKCLEFKYKVPLKRQKKCGCWKSLPIICWRHSLDKVSVETKIKPEDDTELSNFFEKKLM
ncbi:F-box/LRR-repeat protein At2g42720-like [Silene latifolia]|uniref:F-box/LRR-repeat protein At2g42720-like n=1 Tax=Silene latifolia TaxID=37657 RepID=UPI003D789378